VAGLAAAGVAAAAIADDKSVEAEIPLEDAAPVEAEAAPAAEEAGGIGIPGLAAAGLAAAGVAAVVAGDKEETPVEAEAAAEAAVTGEALAFEPPAEAPADEQGGIGVAGLAAAGLAAAGVAAAVAGSEEESTPAAEEASPLPEEWLPESELAAGEGGAGLAAAGLAGAGLVAAAKSSEEGAPEPEEEAAPLEALPPADWQPEEPVAEAQTAEQSIADDIAAMYYRDVVYIEGVGPVYGQKLKEAGIRTPADLLMAGATRKGREDLAEKTGISSRLVLEWVNHVDLFRVKGIGQEYADLLEAAGVDTVPELAQRVPQNLYDRMVQVNEEKKLVRKTPVLSQVESWVAQAKTLHRIVMY
jgi:predicted flap endonuclease-1-like 5' DNA nuclease